MKRKLVVMCMVLALLLFTACGGNENAYTNTPIIKKDAYQFPKGFESWDTVSRNLAGENRYLYAANNRITMPTTVGEWEELLDTEFVEIPSLFSGGVSNYTGNRVGIIDKNGEEYIFHIDTASYEPIENDMVADIEQLRCTSVIGFEISWRGENQGVNNEWGHFISLAENVNMFKDDIEVVNEAIAGEYDVEVKGKTVTVDRFGEGYTFTWHWSEDGDSRTLSVEYVPEHLLAFYQYMDDTKRATGDAFCFSETYNVSEIECNLVDVTYDGIDELVIDYGDARAILAYDRQTGELKWLNRFFRDRIRMNSVLVDIQSFYADGTSVQGEDRFAEYIRRYLYVYNINGDKLHLVTLTQYNDGSSYCINDKMVSEEVYDECWYEYWEPNLQGMFEGTEFKEHLKQSVGTHYASLRSFKDKINNGEGLRVYDDSVIAEVSGEVEDWKENYVALIQEYISRKVAMSDEMSAIQYDNSKSMEEQLAFNVQDINSDGVPELFLQYNDVYSINNGYFEKFHLFLSKGAWHDSMLGVFNQISPSGTELIANYGYSTSLYTDVYNYDGNECTLQTKISYEEGDIYVNSEYVYEVAYTYFDGESEYEISEAEYADYIEYYTQCERQQIEAKKLTIENLENALDIEIEQLDGNGYKIGPKAESPLTETESNGRSMPEPAQSAQQAYEEFLQGKRVAIVDSRYSSAKYAPMLFLVGEKISLAEMGKRVQMDRYDVDESLLKDVQYAYIDCGGDNEQELAVRFFDRNYDEMSEGESICVLKYRDGQLYITYNLVSLHLVSESVLYQNGVMKWHASGAMSNHHYQLEGLNSNGVRYVIYGESEDSGLFRVDEETGEWIYYDEVESVSIYTINGMSYYTVKCSKGYDYDRALEIAKQYLENIGKSNSSLVEQEEIEKRSNRIKEQFHISQEENQEISWMDIQ